MSRPNLRFLRRRPRSHRPCAPRHHLRPFSAALAAFLLTLLPACSPSTPTPPPPSVVLITIDTLRADHLGCYGYFRDTSPTIDAFANDNILFENVFTSMSTTLPAHTSLLTSSYPVRNGVYANFNVWGQPAPTEPGGLRSVAQLFEEAGYETAAFVSVFHLGPGSGVEAGFRTHEGVTAGIEGGESRDVNTRPANVTIDHALAWLEEAGASPAPFFLWIHLFDPHSPYRAPAPYRDSFSRDSPAELRQFIADRRVPELRQMMAGSRINRYDEEIRFVDDQVARIFDGLRAQSEWDESVVILTADHGEGLLEHSVLEHGPIWTEQIHIPLVMKVPADSAREPVRIAELVSIIDVFPTAIAAAGLPIPTDGFDGIDVLSGGRRHVLSEREHTRERFGADVNYALTGTEWKYFLHTEEDDALYRLVDDPEETSNVIDDHPEVATAMREELLRLVHENRARGEGLDVKEDVPPEIREALQALGYVE